MAKSSSSRGNPAINARSRGVGLRGATGGAAPVGTRVGRSAGSRTGTAQGNARGAARQVGATGGSNAKFGGNPSAPGARKIAGTKTGKGGVKPGKVNGVTPAKGIKLTGNA